MLLVPSTLIAAVSVPAATAAIRLPLAAMLLAANGAFYAALIAIGTLVVLVFAAVMGFFALRYGKLWVQAYMSVADVSAPSLIRMHFRT